MLVNKEKLISKLRVAVGAVDVVLFTIFENNLYVLLIPVHRPPHYINLNGLPGGIINYDESAEESAIRHLFTKVGISGAHIEQLYTFSDPKRDKDRKSTRLNSSHMSIS